MTEVHILYGGKTHKGITVSREVCHYPGCENTLSVNRILCLMHWQMVPASARQRFVVAVGCFRAYDFLMREADTREGVNELILSAVESAKQLTFNFAS